jgi:hypothetical protein
LNRKFGKFLALKLNKLFDVNVDFQHVQYDPEITSSPLKTSVVSSSPLKTSVVSSSPLKTSVVQWIKNLTGKTENFHFGSFKKPKIINFVLFVTENSESTLETSVVFGSSPPAASEEDQRENLVSSSVDNFGIFSVLKTTLERSVILKNTLETGGENEIRKNIQNILSKVQDHWIAYINSHILKTTLETSGEDSKNTLQTSEEDLKILIYKYFLREAIESTLETSVVFKNTLETSGEDQITDRFFTIVKMLDEIDNEEPIDIKVSCIFHSRLECSF